MKRILIFISFVFTSIQFTGQSKINYPIYFAYKVSDLDTTEEKRLGVFLRNFDSFSIDSVSIRGYCDDRGRKKINDMLSKKRAENILDFIQTRIKYNLPFNIQGEGSIGLEGDLKIDSQRTLNRRAELELFYSMSKRKDTAKLKTKPAIKEVQPAPTIEISDFLKSAKKGETMDLKIYFAGSSSEILPNSNEELNNLLSYMKSQSERKIKITGHIYDAMAPTAKDSYDVITKDYKLSVNRAKIIYTYLVENGVDALRLSYEGMAAKFPKNKLPEADRRVELEVLE
jgi:outer membrane protein OmpA-like peptidoglycan-associated protein